MSEWNLAVIVCGTRTDTGGSGGGRQVSEADGKGWADKHKFCHVLTSAALGNGIAQAFHTLFVQALQLKDGIRPPGAGGGGGGGGNGGVEPDVLHAIHRLIHVKDDFEKMGLNRRSISKEEVNKSYRRLAAIVHPDKCKATGAEEAFKALTQARNNILKILTETTV